MSDESEFREATYRATQEDLAELMRVNQQLAERVKQLELQQPSTDKLGKVFAICMDLYAQLGAIEPMKMKVKRLETRMQQVSEACFSALDGFKAELQRVEAAGVPRSDLDEFKQLIVRRLEVSSDVMAERMLAAERRHDEVMKRLQRLEALQAMHDPSSPEELEAASRPPAIKPKIKPEEQPGVPVSLADAQLAPRLPSGGYLYGRFAGYRLGSLMMPVWRWENWLDRRATHVVWIAGM